MNPQWSISHLKFEDACSSVIDGVLTRSFFHRDDVGILARSSLGGCSLTFPQYCLFITCNVLVLADMYLGYPPDTIHIFPSDF